MPWITIKKAAEMLSMSERHLRRKIKEGAIQSKKDSESRQRLVLFDEEESEEILNNDKTTQNFNERSVPTNGSAGNKVSPNPLTASRPIKKPSGKRISPNEELMGVLFDVNDGLNDIQNDLLGFYRFYPMLLSVPEHSLPEIKEFRHMILEIHHSLEITREMSQLFTLDSKKLQDIHGKLEKIRDSWVRFFPIYEDLGMTGNTISRVSMGELLDTLKSVIKNIRLLLIGLTGDP